MRATASLHARSRRRVHRAGRSGPLLRFRPGASASQLGHPAAPAQEQTNRTGATRLGARAERRPPRARCGARGAEARVGLGAHRPPTTR